MSIQYSSRRGEVLRGTHSAEDSPKLQIGHLTGSTKNAMLTHKTTLHRKLRGDYSNSTLARPEGFTAQGSCPQRALSQRISEAQLRTT